MADEYELSVVLRGRDEASRAFTRAMGAMRQDAARAGADISRSLGGATRGADAFNRAAFRSHAALGLLSPQAAMAASQITALTNASGGATIALGAVVLGAIAVGGALLIGSKAALNFESSFAGIKKTVDASEQDFTELAKANRRMAIDLATNVNEINRIGEVAGTLGITGVKNIAKFEEIVVKTAEATRIAADDIAMAFGQIANIMQIPIDQMEVFASVLVELGNKGASTEAQILDFATRLAGAASVVGLTGDELLAISSSFASVGVEAERGGTAVQKVLLTMLKAATQGGKELQVFNAVLGTTDAQFRQLFADDPAELFARFVEGLRTAGNDATRVLEELGLADQRLIAAFLAMASADEELRRQLGLGAAETRNNIALQTEFEKRMATTAKQIDRAKASVNDLAITLGTGLLPVLGSAASFASGAAQALQPLAKAVGLVAKNMDILVPAMLAFGAVLLAAQIVKMEIAIIAFTVSVIQMIRAVGASITILALFHGAILGPIGALALLAAAVAATFFFMRRSKSAAQEATEATARWRKETEAAAFGLRLLGIPEHEASIAALAIKYENTRRRMALLKDEIAGLEKELSKAPSSPVDLVGGLDSRGTKNLLALQDELQAVKGDASETSKEISSLVDTINSEMAGLDPTVAAAALEKAGVSAKTIRLLFPTVTSEAGKLKQSFQEFAQTVEIAEDESRTLGDTLGDLAGALSGVRSQISALTGVETKEEAGLRLQISQRGLAISQIEAYGRAMGLSEEALASQTSQLESDKGALDAHLQALQAQRQVAEDWAVVMNSDLLPAQQGMLNLVGVLGKTLDDQGDSSIAASQKGAVLSGVFKELAKYGLSPVDAMLRGGVIPDVATLMAILPTLNTEMLGSGNAMGIMEAQGYGAAGGIQQIGNTAASTIGALQYLRVAMLEALNVGNLLAGQAAAFAIGNVQAFGTTAPSRAQQLLYGSGRRLPIAPIAIPEIPVPSIPPPIENLFPDTSGVGDAAEEAAEEVDILSDGIISLAEALEHGIGAVQAAIQELGYEFDQQSDRLWRSNVQLNKYFILAQHGAGVLREAAVQIAESEVEIAKRGFEAAVAMKVLALNSTGVLREAAVQLAENEVELAKRTFDAAVATEVLAQRMGDGYLGEVLATLAERAVEAREKLLDLRLELVEMYLKLSSPAARARDVAIAAAEAQRDFAERLIEARVQTVLLNRALADPSGVVAEALAGLEEQANETRKRVFELRVEMAQLYVKALDAASSLREAAQLIEEADVAFLHAGRETSAELIALQVLLGRAGLTGQAATFRIALTKLDEEFRQAGESVTAFLHRLASAALDFSQSQLSDILGRPTRETAGLQLQIAELRRDRLRLLQDGAQEDEIRHLLDPIDQEIAALERTLSLREEEIRIMELRAVLADQTLLSDAEMLEQAQLLIGLIAIQSGEVRALNDQLALEQIAIIGVRDALELFKNAIDAARDALAGIGAFGGAQGLAAGSYAQVGAGVPSATFAPRIEISVNNYPNYDNLVRDTVRRVTDGLHRELREAGLRGGFVSTGSYAPE